MQRFLDERFKTVKEYIEQSQLQDCATILEQFYFMGICDATLAVRDAMAPTANKIIEVDPFNADEAEKFYAEMFMTFAKMVINTRSVADNALKEAMDRNKALKNQTP